MQNGGSSSPRGGYEELKRINDSLHQEVVRLNGQVRIGVLGVSFWFRVD